MKIVRVPWIRCRADEVGSCAIDIQWKKQAVKIIAHSEHEAQEWWNGLGSEERDSAVGIVSEESTQTSLW